MTTIPTYKISLSEVLAASTAKSRKRILAAIDAKLIGVDLVVTPVTTVVVKPTDASYEAFVTAYDAAVAKLSKQGG